MGHVLRISYLGLTWVKHIWEPKWAMHMVPIWNQLTTPHMVSFFSPFISQDLHHIYLQVVTMYLFISFSTSFPSLCHPPNCILFFYLFCYPEPLFLMHQDCLVLEFLVFFLSSLTPAKPHSQPTTKEIFIWRLFLWWVWFKPRWWNKSEQK